MNYIFPVLFEIVIMYVKKMEMETYEYNLRNFELFDMWDPSD